MSNGFAIIVETTQSCAMCRSKKIVKVPRNKFNFHKTLCHECFEELLTGDGVVKLMPKKGDADGITQYGHAIVFIDQWESVKSLECTHALER